MSQAKAASKTGQDFTSQAKTIDSSRENSTAQKSQFSKSTLSKYPSQLQKSISYTARG